MKRVTKAKTVKTAKLFPEEVELKPKEGECFLKDLPHGDMFESIEARYTDTYMRVKPVNFLLNSNLVGDCINRGKVFIINLNKGTLFIAPGDRVVVKVRSLK